MTDLDDERMLRLATRIPADDEINIAFSDYACALGRVAYSWNRLHERLGEMFAAVLGGPRAVGIAVWHSSMNDRAQRTMLLAAIEAVPADHWENPRPKARTDLCWLVKETNTLSAHRDNAIHAPVDLVVSHEEAIIAATKYSPHHRAKNLVGKELIVEFDYCERRADTYWEFAGAMTSALLYAHYPWPDRPALPNHRPRTALLSLRHARD